MNLLIWSVTSFRRVTFRRSVHFTRNVGECLPALRPVYHRSRRIAKIRVEPYQHLILLSQCRQNKARICAQSASTCDNKLKHNLPPCDRWPDGAPCSHADCERRNVGNGASRQKEGVTALPPVTQKTQHQHDYYYYNQQLSIETQCRIGRICRKQENAVQGAVPARAGGSGIQGIQNILSFTIQIPFGARMRRVSS